MCVLVSGLVHTTVLSEVPYQYAVALHQQYTGSTAGRTLTSMPASAKESRRFWGWAGAWEPHPITPTLLMPEKAAGSLEYLSRPPLQQQTQAGRADTGRAGGKAGRGQQQA